MASLKYSLRLKIEDDYLTGEYLKLNNARTYEKIMSDAGFDLVLPEDVFIPARTFGKLIDLKIRAEMLKTKQSLVHSSSDTDHVYSMTFTNVSYDLRARSSICKTPLMLCNSVGTIDAGYRGVIKAAVNNFSEQDVTLKKGERYFQLVAPALSPFDVSFVYSLSETIRGDGGFGSTGK
jgi:deoxycytidine triphosphate deaminase